MNPARFAFKALEYLGLTFLCGGFCVAILVALTGDSEFGDHLIAILALVVGLLGAILAGIGRGLAGEPHQWHETRQP